MNLQNLTISPITTTPNVTTRHITPADPIVTDETLLSGTLILLLLYADVPLALTNKLPLSELKSVGFSGDVLLLRDKVESVVVTLSASGLTSLAEFVSDDPVVESTTVAAVD